MAAIISHPSMSGAIATCYVPTTLSEAFGAAPSLWDLVSRISESVCSYLPFGPSVVAQQTVEGTLRPIAPSLPSMSPSCSSEIVAKLFEGGSYPVPTTDCRIDDKELWGVSPVHAAVIQGNKAYLDASLQALKSSASTIDQVKQIPGVGNLVHLAIYSNQYGALEHLLTEHWDLFHSQIHQENDKGETPLMLAALLSNPRAIHLLYKKNVDLEYKNQFGQRAIHFAAMASNEQAFVLLHHFGVRMTGKDHAKLHPIDYLHKAVLAESDPEKRAEKQSAAVLFEQLEALNEKNLDALKRVDWLSHPPENLVFQGGGPKGIVYMGALKVLEEHGLLGQLKRAAGTSAGAIQSALLAMGYNSEEMIEAFNSIDPKEFMDHPVLKVLGAGSTSAVAAAASEAAKVAIEDAAHKISQGDLEVLVNAYKAVEDNIQTLVFGLRAATGTLTPLEIAKASVDLIKALANLRKTTGICSGDVFREWMDEKIAKKAALALGKKPEDCRYLTFGELRKEFIDKGIPGFLHLYVKATQVKKGDGIIKSEPVTINSEDGKWDNVVISDAVRASMSIPGLFKPHCLHVQSKDVPSGLFDAKLRKDMRLKDTSFGQFLDGGIIANFMINQFDYHQFISGSQSNGADSATNLRTLGLRNHWGAEHAVQTASSTKIVDLLLNVTGFLSSEGLKQLIESALDSKDGFNGKDVNAIVESIDTLLRTDKDKIDTADDIVKAVKNTYQDAERYYLSMNRINKERTISIDNLGVALWDFGTDPIPLLTSGENTATKAVETFTAKEEFENPVIRHALEAAGVTFPLKYPSKLMQLSDNLETLHRKLFQRSQSSLPKQAILWSKGDEKRELAISFRNQYAKDFSDIIWVTPENEESVYRSFAKSLKIEGSSTKALDALRSQVYAALERSLEKKPYLIFFEGFKDICSLPSGNRGRFIILSDEKPPENADALHPRFLSKSEKEYLHNNYFREIFNRLHNPNCEKKGCWDLDERYVHPKEKEAIKVVNDEYWYNRWIMSPSFNKNQELLRLRADDPRPKALFLSTDQTSVARAVHPRVHADVLRELNRKADLKFKKLVSYNEICNEIRRASSLGTISDLFIQAEKNNLLVDAEMHGTLIPDRLHPFSECYDETYAAKKPRPVFRG